MPLILARRAGLLAVGPGSGGPPSGGGGGGSGGGTSPLGVGGLWGKVYETTFQGDTLDPDFYKNRGPGPYPNNVGTNNPSIQLDTSYSENVIVNNGLLTMNYSNQPDPNLASQWPYAGAHIQGKTGWITADSFVELVIKIYDRGSGWPAIAHYGNTGGEIDHAEYGNTASGKAPTFNVHDRNYTAQNQSLYTGAPQLAGDGKFHVYGMRRNGLAVTPYLDGVQCDYTRNILENTDYRISLELGVAKSGIAKLLSLGAGIQSTRITVWHG